MGKAMREIEHLRELTALQFKLHRRALKLQASDYAGHLERLNNESGRIKEIDAAKVSSELFNSKVGQLEKDVETINLTLATKTGANTAYMVVVSAAVSAIMLALTAAAALYFIHPK
jgi:hypothetical protein